MWRCDQDGVIFSIAIPEPATFTILAATGACLLLRRRRGVRAVA
ncbi:MAG TPA: PEP-CTERM sorting domain-containing protein [Tepidisphaeraceae bacterium]|nr:PEP-CTERM sorting domain-containing protein [Tepidisphaeraceae bacterium]